MASSYEIKNGRLIFRNNGEEYIDDAEKKHISGSFTEIEFPSCFNELYDDDFKACRNQLAKVTKLDFTKATRIETIGDDTFTGASSLKVVVLPKKVTAINEFKKCPNLKEIHIYKLEDLYSITKDEDKRLTVYVSQVSSDIDSFDDGFLSDVGILYVPANKVRQMEEARDEYDDELDIRPLPDGYSFPTHALSEPMGSSSVVDYDADDFDSSLHAASSYKIIGKRLVFIDNGESCIDDEEKENISGNFTEIEFPPCFDELYDDDFDACRDQLAKVTKLDFSKAVNIETIGDKTFTGAKSLKVVVLPKKVTNIPCFYECPNIQEIHIYDFEGDVTGWFRDNYNEKTIKIYASKIVPDNLLSRFMAHAENGTIYVPKDQVSNVKREFENCGHGDVSIMPLPDGYTFPTEALSEPWQPGGATLPSEDETMLCPNCGERHSINIDVCPNCGFSTSDSCEVVLVSAGRTKLQLVKAIKEACNYGLKEAKDIADSALPTSVIRGISEEMAEEIKLAIESAGGKAKINGGETTAKKNCGISTSDSCEVVLVSAGRTKLQLVKAIKEACNYGLKEAKDIADSTLPALVIRGISEEMAEEIKVAIEAAGGKAKINGGETTAEKQSNSSTASVLTASAAVSATPTSSSPKAITHEDIYGGPQYYCVLAGQSFGPVTIRQFANMLRFGIADKNTMVWKDGMSNWALAQTVADLQAVL